MQQVQGCNKHLSSFFRTCNKMFGICFYLFRACGLATIGLVLVPFYVIGIGKSGFGNALLYTQRTHDHLYVILCKCTTPCRLHTLSIGCIDCSLNLLNRHCLLKTIISYLLLIMLRTKALHIKN